MLYVWTMTSRSCKPFASFYSPFIVTNFEGSGFEQGTGGGYGGYSDLEMNPYSSRLLGEYAY